MYFSDNYAKKQQENVEKRTFLNDGTLNCEFCDKILEKYNNKYRMNLDDIETTDIYKKYFPRIAVRNGVE